MFMNEKRRTPHAAHSLARWQHMACAIFVRLSPLEHRLVISKLKMCCAGNALAVGSTQQGWGTWHMLLQGLYMISLEMQACPK